MIRLGLPIRYSPFAIRVLLIHRPNRLEVHIFIDRMGRTIATEAGLFEATEGRDGR